MNDFRLDNMLAYYINLNQRSDRKIHMEAELERVGLKAERFEAINSPDFTWPKKRYAAMLAGTPNAIGCHESQVAVMRMAMNEGKDVLIMEDDLIICTDVHKRLEHISVFLNSHKWDVFWLGGTYHRDRAVWHPELGKDWELTDDVRIVKTYGCWSTFAYIVNHKSIPKILPMFEELLPVSIGIDWLFIQLQPKLETFAFVPGCVKQYDNQSNIGKGITKFSGFAELGSHWFANTM